jgi:uncharacterized protein with von Willebrand factor type A (vWA) domain
MALAELITTRYPKDTLDILVLVMMLGQLQLRFTMYLRTLSYQYGCRLQLAMDILRRKRNTNKQIL